VGLVGVLAIVLSAVPSLARSSTVQRIIREGQDATGQTTLRWAVVLPPPGPARRRTPPLTGDAASAGPADTGSMFGRKRRQERRFDQEAMRYQMRERMISIGDDYEIENDRGERVYKLDGKALRIRKTIVFKDMDGRELAKIQERMLHIKDSMEIEGPDGNRIAIVKKALITPLRERWIIKVEDGQDLDVHGNIVDHEYQIERDGVKVAEVSKRWFRIRDTYGVEVAPGENDILILASAAVLDTMAHPAK
jgi:uncharacterized protein YxjI